MRDELSVIGMIVVVLLLAWAIDGCNQQKYVEPDTTKITQTKLHYLEDQYGNCFAALTSQGYMGYTTTSLATVPCENLPTKPIDEEEN